MPWLGALVGLVLVVLTLLDAFEVVLLPRPVRRRWRINMVFFAAAWAAWAWLARRLRPGRRREDFAGVFGPLSMVALFSAWAILLMVGFGLLHWSLQQLLGGDPPMTLAQAMGVSGDAFFTLGYGDVVPRHATGRLLVIVEAGTGFGFIALTISYLPVLYQHFSRRDYQLVDFAARAGTPPTVAGLLAWHAAVDDPAAFTAWLRDWELWASDMVESHSAYPMLAFYRSQHEGHSWLAALAVLLDVCALLIAGDETGGPPQAAATFTAARSALRVVAGSLEIAVPSPSEAWSHAPGGAPGEAGIASLAPFLGVLGAGWRADAGAAERFGRLRRTCRPHLLAIAAYLLLDLPEWGDASPRRVGDVMTRLTGEGGSRD
ncbi:MAG: two pore domain potassium channel family protein [Variovorax sp.]|nr:MAG: two pore domain potassium channel family protein [Variovorax sp.]